ncbi:GNAT family N-acetyltransferase [Paenibacillus sp. HN-1]|nr:GNAT family N-acetyltransferase [Paenibacillus sp. CGMCC 1.18879]MBY9087178.1 GNAT family N-acetyltransferase [Paenibacillus sinensis]
MSPRYRIAMGDRETGEMWVIAVLPEYINKGIGTGLLQLVEKWLWESGCKALWLTTDLDIRLRAYSFYRKNGWQDDRLEDGLRYMVKSR